MVFKRPLVDNTVMAVKVPEQGRSQEFATGDKRGGLGDGSPPAGPRGRAPVGNWGLSPQKPETNANFQL